jgi:hypothetical protein
MLRIPAFAALALAAAAPTPVEARPFAPAALAAPAGIEQAGGRWDDWHRPRGWDRGRWDDHRWGPPRGYGYGYGWGPPPRPGWYYVPPPRYYGWAPPPPRYAPARPQFEFGFRF